MFRLYGFLHVMRGQTLHPDLTQIRTSLHNLKAELSCLTTQKSGTGGGDSSGRRGCSARNFPALKVDSLALITVKGYQLSPEYNQSCPENMKRAEKDGRVVALKLVDTKERNILEAVQTNGTYENHVVELIDVISSIDAANHDIIVMPWLSPLDTIDLGDTDWNLLMTQFLDGIWFLHKSGIAHLDLKPGNVLVKYNDSLVPHLSIIDFGVSIHVNDDETLVTGFRGTPAWMALEVGRKGGSAMTYSAIQADQWSCGLMLQYFCPNAALFSHVHKKLLNPDPRRRPSLDIAIKMLQEVSCRAKRNIDEDMDSATPKRARTTVLNLNIEAL